MARPRYRIVGNSKEDGTLLFLESFGRAYHFTDYIDPEYEIVNPSEWLLNFIKEHFSDEVDNIRIADVNKLT